MWVGYSKIQKGEGNPNHDAQGRFASAPGLAAVSDLDKLRAKVSNSRYLNNLLLQPEWRKALTEMGNTPETQAKVDALYTIHNQGGPGQAAGDAAIADALNNNTPEGKCMRDAASLEADMYRAWQSGVAPRAAADVAEKQKDWDSGYISHGHSNSFDDYMQENEWELLKPSAVIGIYRGGRTDGQVQSWTQDPNGANTGGGGRIKPTVATSIDRALSAGALILGGLNRAMGAPGEAEVTLFWPKDANKGVIDKLDPRSMRRYKPTA